MTTSASMTTPVILSSQAIQAWLGTKLDYICKLAVRQLWVYDDLTELHNCVTPQRSEDLTAEPMNLPAYQGKCESTGVKT